MKDKNNIKWDYRSKINFIINLKNLNTFDIYYPIFSFISMYNIQCLGVEYIIYNIYSIVVGTYA